MSQLKYSVKFIFLALIFASVLAVGILTAKNEVVKFFQKEYPSGSGAYSIPTPQDESEKFNVKELEEATLVSIEEDTEVSPRKEEKRDPIKIEGFKKWDLSSAKKITGILLILFLVLFLLWKWKRRVRTEQTLFAEMKEDKKSTSSQQNKPTNYAMPVEQIRQALIQWEKTLPSNQQRQSHETIQQWFGRIQKSDDFVLIYEKVRYGKQTITNEEVEQCRGFLFGK